MHITWHGQTCIKLQSKNLDKDSVILIDPYKPNRGAFPRSFTSDVALFSVGLADAVTLSQNPFIIDTAGEFELKNVVIYSLASLDSVNIFKIFTEAMTIVHLGRLNKKLDNGHLEQIQNPDILFISVGGAQNGNNAQNYLDPKTAAELITALEPRVVIPIGFKCDTDPDVKPVSNFISELGLKPENAGKKIIIKKKELPAEETRLIILDKE